MKSSKSIRNVFFGLALKWNLLIDEPSAEDTLRSIEGGIKHDPVGRDNKKTIAMPKPKNFESLSKAK